MVQGWGRGLGPGTSPAGWIVKNISNLNVLNNKIVQYYCLRGMRILLYYLLFLISYTKMLPLLYIAAYIY